MKRPIIFALAAATAVFGAGVAVAGEIYKFTDSSGTVHYVDRPTGIASEVRVPISSRPTNPAEVQARAQARYSHTSSADENAAGEDPEQEKQTRAERLAAEKQRAEQCQQYRDRLETYVTSRRLYRETGDGEREYLDDEEVLDARRQTEDLVHEYCD